MKFFWGKSYPKTAQFLTHGFHGDPQPIDHLPPPISLKPSKTSYLPDKKGWIDRVEIALKKIERGDLEKVVLARVVDLEFKAALDPFAITAALTGSPGSTLFCFADEEKAFLGATPERLFTRRGRKIECDAMAGTKWDNHPFGDKEKREHKPVQDFLAAALSPIAKTPIHFSPLEVHKAHSVQHLKSICQTEIPHFVSDREIIARLHPTPALSGASQQKALSLIRELEPFDREFYGTVLGWSTEEAAEYVVAIRCCMIRANRVRIYSGVGIVAGSNPETEWEELNHKLELFEGILL